MMIVKKKKNMTILYGSPDTKSHGRFVAFLSLLAVGVMFLADGLHLLADTLISLAEGASRDPTPHKKRGWKPSLILLTIIHFLRIKIMVHQAVTSHLLVLGSRFPIVTPWVNRDPAAWRELAPNLNIPWVKQLN